MVLIGHRIEQHQGSYDHVIAVNQLVPFQDTGL